MRPRMRTLFAQKSEWPRTIKHLIWLEENTCNAHGVAYIHHPNCYYREYPNTDFTERVGFLDIEATNLKANFGVVICWCIKPAKSKNIIEGCVTTRDMRSGERDKRIIEKLVSKMRKFDRLVAHYGTDCKFDFPFIRSRALRVGVDFPIHKEIWATDTWNIAKRKLCLSSNRLETIADFLGISIKKTPITTEHWLDALSGRKKSLDYILEHCRRDVLILEKVYNKIYAFSPRSKTSI